MKTTTSAWALITGASGGIGKEFASQLARSGWNLVLASRSLDKLETLRGELLTMRQDASFRVEVIPTDLSQPGAAKSLHQACLDRGLPIELLVNNAGAGLFGECTALESAALDAMLNLNIHSLTTLCALFGKDMQARRSGSILNVGSFAGNQGTPYFAAYAASKSYVLYFSLAIRAELAPYGVRVTCLQPGYVATAFDANAGIASPKYLKFSARNSLPPQAVAKAGLKALARNKPWHIPGFLNRIGAAFFGLLPISWPPRLMKHAIDGMKT